MAGCHILKKMGGAVNLHEGDEMVLQKFFHISQSSWWIIEAPMTSSREATPDHEGIWVFNSFHHELTAVTVWSDRPLLMDPLGSIYMESQFIDI
jgi:hypothetical protein